MRLVLLQDRLRLGGTEVQALELAQRWAEAGHEPRLVVFRPGGELADTDDARRHQPVTLQKRDWGLDIFAPRLLKTVAEMRPDVVVAFGREANAKLPKLARLHPRPALIATLRSGRDQPRRFWRALKMADAVVANARWAAQAAVAAGVSGVKVQVIYNGVARDALPADPAAACTEWRARAHTPEGAVVLLCIAAFRTGKGQDNLLRAVARLPKDPPWQLWLAGQGQWLQSCQKLALGLKLQDRVRFTGMTRDPASLYAAADVAVLASLAEALPNFLLEAQAAGLPVVATDVGGVVECFADGQTGLSVPDGDPKALVDALARAIRDTAWREAAHQPAQDRVRELFDPVRNATAWLEVMRDARGI